MLHGVGKHFNRLTVENGTDVFSETSIINCQPQLSDIQEDRRSQAEKCVRVEGTYRGADKSLARPGRKEALKHVRDAREFNKIETRAASNFLFLQGKSPKEIRAILTETLACLLPGRAKNLSAPLYLFVHGRYRWRVWGSETP